MNRKIFLFIVMLVSLQTSISSQSTQYFRVTANNVVVRKYPNVKARRVKEGLGYGFFNSYISLSKGAIVFNEGKRKNGYVLVSDTYYYAMTKWEDAGWVAAKFLIPAVKCKDCSGEGVLNQKCTHCNGEGCDWCWRADGQMVCESCDGVGYR